MKRYDIHASQNTKSRPVLVTTPSDDGEWIRFADVEDDQAIIDGLENENDVYRTALFKIQGALDVRCIDHPNTVGCNDRLFDMPEHEIAELKKCAAEWERRARNNDLRMDKLQRKYDLALWKLNP